MPRKFRGWPGREPGYSLDIGSRICDRMFRVSDNPDEREQKSVDQQEGEYELWAPRRGVLPGRVYIDDDRSASEFATKEREGMTEMRADMAAGKLDGHVIWFWASNRQTRGDIPLDTLAAEARAHGVVWVMGGEVLNPANGKNMTTARLHYTMDVDFSTGLSDVVTRGKEAAAKQGKPAAVPLYGYRRVYEKDSRGGLLLVKGRPVILGDEFNEADEHGNPVPGTPYAIAREIFDRVEALEPFTVIAASLEDRPIPAPRRPRKCTTCGEKMHKDRGKGQVKGYYCSRGHEQDLCRWNPSAVRFIAMNESYRARRIYGAESASPADRRAAVLDGVEAKWPPLVTERQFQAVQNAIEEQGKLRWRGGDGGHSRVSQYTSSRSPLCVPATRCAECGGAAGITTSNGKDWYKCYGRGCTMIRADWLDAWAEDRLLSWWVLPEVEVAFRASRDDTETDELLATIERENRALKELVELAREGKGGSPEMRAATEEGILARKTEAEAQLKLRGQANRGAAPDARNVADEWHKLRTDAPDAARRLLATVASIYIHRAPSRGGGATQRFDEGRA